MSFYVGTPAKSPPAAAASAASSFAALPSASGTSGWRRFVRCAAMMERSS